MTTLVLTGTSTGVGKTVATAAIAGLAAAAGRRVAVLKSAQAGYSADEPGDIAAVRWMLGESTVTTRELRRYPDPLSPDIAARRSGIPAVSAQEIAAAAGGLAAEHDVVLIEGAGGLLVRFDEAGSTVADVAWSLGAPAVIVASPALGTLNHTALTALALEQRGVDCVGVLIGEWPDVAGLAERCNVAELPLAAGAPLLGALPAGLGKCTGQDFLAAAAQSLSPWFGGSFDPETFTAEIAATLN